MRERSFADHWVDLPEWANDRRLWAFYFTFEGFDAVRERVAALQSRLLGVPGLDRVEPRWLHMTVLGVAFEDEIGRRALEDLKAAATGLLACEAPVRMRATGYAPDHDALLLPVATDPPLAGLRERLRRATEDAIGRTSYRLPEPAGGFDPHITIAYARSETWSVERIDRCFAACPVPEIRFEPSHLSLVRLRRGSDRWTWDEATAFAFAGAARRDDA